MQVLPNLPTQLYEYIQQAPIADLPVGLHKYRIGPEPNVQMGKLQAAARSLWVEGRTGPRPALVRQEGTEEGIRRSM
jgi:hypothetical protein